MKLGNAKKIICMLIVVCSLLSYEQACTAKCLLSPIRWQWVDSSADVGVFYDKKSVRYNAKNRIVSVWIGYYYPSNKACEHPTSYGEHYHYEYTFFDLKYNMVNVTDWFVRDSDNANVLDSGVYRIGYEIIPPESFWEEALALIKSHYILK
nr:MAG TPA: Surface-adhesin protein E [Caudoviricetes sp.]